MHERKQRRAASDRTHAWEVFYVQVLTSLLQSKSPYVQERNSIAKKKLSVQNTLEGSLVLFAYAIFLDACSERCLFFITF